MRPGPLLDLQREYEKRIGRELEIREMEERRKLPPPDLTAREGALLLGAVPEGAATIVLDERGQALASTDLATRLATWRDAARPAAFLIGGADGHAAGLRERADLLLSFGRMTWPHLLARIMLLEQLYRARQILAGHPYHRG
jgi:23S rRNA (pseudouridine1915-N3)-methyltransferase